MYIKTSLETYAYEQRVDRVTGFLSSRPNWVHPPPQTQVNMPPPPLVPGKGRTGLREREWVDPIRTSSQTLWYSRYRTIPAYEHLVSFCSLCTTSMYVCNRGNRCLPRTFLCLTLLSGIGWTTQIILSYTREICLQIGSFFYLYRR
jgi:hypothetical protein